MTDVVAFTERVVCGYDGSPSAAAAATWAAEESRLNSVVVNMGEYRQRAEQSALAVG